MVIPSCNGNYVIAKAGPAQDRGRTDDLGAGTYPLSQVTLSHMTLHGPRLCGLRRQAAVDPLFLSIS